MGLGAPPSPLGLQRWSGDSADSCASVPSSPPLSPLHPSTQPGPPANRGSCSPGGGGSLPLGGFRGVITLRFGKPGGTLSFRPPGGRAQALGLPTLAAARWSLIMLPPWPTFPWQPSKGMIQGHPMPRVPSQCLLPSYLYCIPTCSPDTHAPCQAPGLECFRQELPVVHKPALLCHPGLSLACVFSSFKFFSGSSSPFPSTSP